MLVLLVLLSWVADSGATRGSGATHGSATFSTYYSLENSPLSGPGSCQPLAGGILTGRVAQDSSWTDEDCAAFCTPNTDCYGYSFSTQPAVGCTLKTDLTLGHTLGDEADRTRAANLGYAVSCNPGRCILYGPGLHYGLPKYVEPVGSAWEGRSGAAQNYHFIGNPNGDLNVTCMRKASVRDAETAELHALCDANAHIADSDADSYARDSNGLPTFHLCHLLKQGVRGTGPSDPCRGIHDRFDDRGKPVDCAYDEYLIDNPPYLTTRIGSIASDFRGRCRAPPRVGRLEGDYWDDFSSTGAPGMLDVGILSLSLRGGVHGCLTDCRIRVLPATFGQSLYNLRKLDLRDNELTVLPETFGQGMPNLRYLHLSGNQLIALPASFGLPLIFNRLIGLDLRHNSLTQLPDNFGLGMDLPFTEEGQRDCTSATTRGMFQQLLHQHAAHSP
jgi:hypothetical protein